MLVSSGLACTFPLPAPSSLQPVDSSPAERPVVADGRTDGQVEGGEGSPVDASPPDRSSLDGCLALPVASPTAKVATGCPEVTLELGSQASTPGSCGSGIKITLWRVTTPGKVLLTQFSGNAGAAASGTKVVGGTFASPLISPTAHQGGKAAKVTILVPGKNMQLFQISFLLDPQQSYELRFKARSQPDRLLGQVRIHQHTSPYSSYGLNETDIQLTGSWQSFAFSFKTNDLLGGGSTTDTRLQISMDSYDQAGDVFWFDDVKLIRVATGANVLQDSSFEAATDGWSSFFDASGSYVREAIPTVVSGLYTVGLTGTDDCGCVSPEAVTTVQVPSCP